VDLNPGGYEASAGADSEHGIEDDTRSVFVARVGPVPLTTAGGVGNCGATATDFSVQAFDCAEESPKRAGGDFPFELLGLSVLGFAECPV
jgi:hypothetical protein